MAIKLGDAFVELFGKRDKLNQDLGKAKEDTRAWTVAVGTMAGNLMTGVIKKTAEIATKAIVGLGKSLVDMTLEAAQVEGVRNTFDNLVQSIGGDAVKAMNDLRAATRGMVSDSDLMLAGNKFLAMGLAETTDQAAELAEIATQLGMAMGEDATASMENFALMMANQSIPRLDSFGISSGKVRARIEELMAATEGLTREQAFNQAVMEQARVTMEKVGEQGATSAAKMATMQATLENLRLKAGEALAPIRDVFVNLASNLVATWGPKIEDWLTNIQGPIGSFAEALEKLFAGNVPGFFGSLSDALIALGVPEEVLGRIHWAIQDFGGAIQALKDGDPRGFIDGVKMALVDLGVPVEFVEKLEDAFWWLLDAWEKVSTFWTGTLKPILVELWESVLQPALEGLKQLFIDLKPLLIALGAALLLYLVAPMILAALPVIALGVALVTLGLLWKEYGEEVKRILNQLGAIIAHFFGQAIDWVAGLLEAISSLGIIGKSILGTLGLPPDFAERMRESAEAMRNFAQARADAAIAIQTETPGGGRVTNIGDMFAQWLESQGQTNQDNRRNFTNYGGIQMFGDQGFGNSLEDLWEMGQT